MHILYSSHNVFIRYDSCTFFYYHLPFQDSSSFNGCSYSDFNFSNRLFHIYSKKSPFIVLDINFITVINCSVSLYLHGRDVWYRRGLHLPRQRLWKLLWIQ
jgi:hypothetical protein